MLARNDGIFGIKTTIQQKGGEPMHCQIDSGTFVLAIYAANQDSQFFVQYKLKSLWSPNSQPVSPYGCVNIIKPL